MASETHIRNITLVGASGNVGSYALKYLLEAKRDFNITAISRQGSTATLPSAPNLTVKTGDYTDSAFLQSALRGQDVLLLTFGFMTPPEIQNNFINAAAKAGVPWIIPNEYSSDPLNKRLTDAAPMFTAKAQHRELIEKLGKSSWIGIATGFWLDHCMITPPYLSIEIKGRKADILDDGNTPVVYSTLPQIGRAIASLVSLPIESKTGGGPSLADYKNGFVYIRSFTVTQNEILAAAQRATRTSADWNISFTPAQQYVEEGKAILATGNPLGGFRMLLGTVLTKGIANEHFGRELANEKLGLPEESFEDVVRQACHTLESRAHDTESAL